MDQLPRLPKAVYMIVGATLLASVIALAAFIISLLGDTGYLILWGVLTLWLGGAIGKWTYEARVARVEAERRYAQEKAKLDETIARFDSRRSAL